MQPKVLRKVSTSQGEEERVQKGAKNRRSRGRSVPAYTAVRGYFTSRLLAYTAVRGYFTAHPRAYNAVRGYFTAHRRAYTAVRDYFTSRLLAYTAVRGYFTAHPRAYSARRIIAHILPCGARNQNTEDCE